MLHVQDGTCPAIVGNVKANFFMKRKLEIVLPPQVKWTRQCCVYKMIIGDCFYIGRTQALIKRSRSHKYENETLLAKYSDFPGLVKDDDYRFKIFHFLVKNPNVNTLRFEVLQFCKKPVNTIEHERKWIRKFTGTDGFLNMPANMNRYNVQEEDDF